MVPQGTPKAEMLDGRLGAVLTVQTGLTIFEELQVHRTTWRIRTQTRQTSSCSEKWLVLLADISEGEMD